ncbi:MAG: MBL fold metallo-hydrolase [Methanolobus sp.]
MGNTTIDGVFIKWLGNSGFMIKGEGMVVYIDPVNIKDSVPEDEMADLLLITHEHFGHCDPDSIRKVRKSDCTTLIPEKMSLQFRGDARRIMEGDSLSGELSIKGVDIEVVSTYDSCENATSLGKGVGYFMNFEGLGIYHAGHTCIAAEIDSDSIDLAFLPLGADGVMDEERAAVAAELLRPKYLIPMSYTPESDLDIEKLTSLVKDKSPSTEIVIL